ncbi:MAG: glycosyltransferase family 117 protein [Endomicrobiales bacterium]
MTLIIFLATFSLYLFNSAPSFTVGDSGEFCAASVILGLAHSPGYPLYCLLGKAATLAFPFASPAFRVSLLSALFGALAVTLLYRAVLVFVEGRDGAGDAGAGADTGAARWIFALPVLLFAVSSAFWRSAIQAEVFTLNAFFAALIIYAVMKRKDSLAAFALGLGLGNHHTLVFLGPLAAAAAFRSGIPAAKKSAALALCFAAGFSVYLYLPVRAHKTPALDWGSPKTAHALWRVITRADYGSMSLTTGEKIPRTAENTARHMARFGADLGRQFTVPGFLAVLFGFWWALKKKYPHARTLLFTWLLAGPAFALLANMPFNSETDGIMERFYVLVNLFMVFPLAVCAGLLLKERRKAALFAAAGTAALACLTVLREPRLNWRQYYLAYDYGRNILRTLAPGAVFFMDGGDDTFYSTAYLCFAEGRRKDVELHDRGGLVFKNIYGPDFRKLPRLDKEGRRLEVEKGFLGLRPLYYSTFNKELLHDVPLEPDGFLYRPKDMKSRNAWPLYSLRGVYDREYGDYRSRALVPVYPYFGEFHDKGGRTSFWDYAYTKWPEALWLKSNLRIELAQEAFRRYRAGDRAGARAAYARMLEWYPSDAPALVNAGVIEKEMKNTAGAVEYYRRATAADPGFAEGYYNLAVIAWENGDWALAAENFRKVLERQPSDERARHFLPLAEERLKGGMRR